MDVGLFIIGIILWGMLIGAAAQWLFGAKASNINWGMALGAGLLGSFVGGMLGSLIAGEGLHFRPSGIIGSLIGAFIVTGIWMWIDRRRADS